MDCIGCKNSRVGHNPRLQRCRHFLFMTERTLLCGRELAVWRGERCLFERLQFELAPQQLALLVGANGSGKTTLLRIVAGLGLPTVGSVTWNGSSVTELAAEQRAQI